MASRCQTGCRKTNENRSYGRISFPVRLILLVSCISWVIESWILPVGKIDASSILPNSKTVLAISKSPANGHLTNILTKVSTMSAAQNQAPMIPADQVFSWSPPQDFPSPVTPNQSFNFSTGFSCPSVSLCVVSGPDGEYATTNPLLGGSSWVEESSLALTSLSCPSTTLCVGTSAKGIVTSTDPTGGPSKWVISNFNIGDTVVCVSTALCVSDGGKGPIWHDWTPYRGMLVSTNPTGAASAWVNEPFTDATWSGLGGVFPYVISASCVSTLCVFAMGNGVVLASSNVLDPNSWRGEEIDINPPPPTRTSLYGYQITSVSCPSVSLCLAAGDGGYVFMSRYPTNGTPWTKVGPFSYGYYALGVSGLSCPSVSICFVAADQNEVVNGQLLQAGYVYESNNPGSAVSNWHISVTLEQDTMDTLAADISCPTTSLCIGGGYYSAESSGYPTYSEVYVGTTPDVAIASTPDSKGYWIVPGDGGLYAYGDAANYGSTGNMALNAPIVGMASTPDGKGYWEVASDGGVFAFGDANFYGSMVGKPLNGPIVSMAATSDGKGYWEVGSDGGVFAFGDANFYGSMAGKPLNSPIVSMAATSDGKGYWEVASHGGVFAFGDANFYGSMAGKPLNSPIVSIAATSDGKGYWEVASDGGVFAFGDAKFYGSAA